MNKKFVYNKRNNRNYYNKNNNYNKKYDKQTPNIPEK